MNTKPRISAYSPRKQVAAMKAVAENCDTKNLSRAEFNKRCAEMAYFLYGNKTR